MKKDRLLKQFEDYKIDGEFIYGGAMVRGGYCTVDCTTCDDSTMKNETPSDYDCDEQEGPDIEMPAVFVRVMNLSNVNALNLNSNSNSNSTLTSSSTKTSSTFLL